MSNIGLIIGHEYTSRVMKKSFILVTLLTPFIMVIVMALPTWLLTREDGTKKEIVVIDESGLYGEVFESNDTYSFLYVDGSVETARTAHSEATGFLRISGDLTQDNQKVVFYSEKQTPEGTVSYIRHQLNRMVEQQKIDASGIEDLKQIIKSVETDIQITTIKLTDDGEEQITSAFMSEMMGMVAAFLIYMFIMMYGSMVMQSVVKEKSNRIMEVMVATTHPFDLMMGKIIAVALVGLTQFLIWVILLAIAGSVIMSVLASNVGIDLSQALETANNIQNDNTTMEVINAVVSFNFLKIIVLFIVYFIGGYLLYSSLFAAIGSAVDNETDTQQFVMPITTLMMLAMYAGFYATQHPYEQFTIWCSMIPFTSPVVMLVRLAYDVAWWEIALSLIILVVSFVATTWLAAKIYRVGILMYGKKPSWKEVIKWIKY